MSLPSSWFDDFTVNHFLDGIYTDFDTTNYAYPGNDSASWQLAPGGGLEGTGTPMWVSGRDTRGALGSFEFFKAELEVIENGPPIRVPGAAVPGYSNGYRTGLIATDGSGEVSVGVGLTGSLDLSTNLANSYLELGIGYGTDGLWDFIDDDAFIGDLPQPHKLIFIVTGDGLLVGQIGAPDGALTEGWTPGGFRARLPGRTVARRISPDELAWVRAKAGLLVPAFGMGEYAATGVGIKSWSYEMVAAGAQPPAPPAASLQGSVGAGGIVRVGGAVTGAGVGGTVGF